jgi:hypothetical protein
MLSIGCSLGMGSAFVLRTSAGVMLSTGEVIEADVVVSNRYGIRAGWKATLTHAARQASDSHVCMRVDASV